MSLVESVTKKPTLFLSLFGITFLLGLFGAWRLPLNPYPKVEYPYFSVTTIVPGSAPEEIDLWVSQVLEKHFRGIAGIRRMNAYNEDGFSQIWIELHDASSLEQVEKEVRERIQIARPDLPAQAEFPVIERSRPNMQPVMVMALVFENEISNQQWNHVFQFVDEKLPHLVSKIPGVGRIESIGSHPQEVKVSLDRKKLKDFGLSISQVAEQISLRGQSTSLGSHSESQKRISVRTLNPFTTIEDLKSQVVNFFGNDRAVQLREIGDVRLEPKKDQPLAYCDGSPCVLVRVYPQLEANAVQTAKSLNQIFENLAEETHHLPGSPKWEVVRDSSVSVKDSLHDVFESSLVAIFLTILCIWVFLKNWRSTLVTGLSLPLSIAGALVAMYILGFSLNMMTLLALSLTIGLLVDDAIVVRENIFRHLESGLSPIKAAIRGTTEVRAAVAATTLTIISVFGPVALIPGLTGAFLKEFGATVCFAMLWSWLDAIVFAPLFSALLGREKRTTISTPKKIEIWSQLLTKLESSYQTLLQVSLSRPKLTLLVSACLFVLLMTPVLFLPATFLPSKQSGEFRLLVSLPPNSALEATRKKVLGLEKSLRTLNFVESSSVIVGQEKGGTSRAEFFVRLKLASGNVSQLKESLRKHVLASYKDLTPVLLEYDDLFGDMSPISLDLVGGKNSEELEKYAKALLKKLGSSPFVRDGELSLRDGREEWQITYLPEKMARLGILPDVSNREAMAQTDGLLIGNFLLDNQKLDLRVGLAEDQSAPSQLFASGLIPNVNGSLIHLKSFSESKVRKAPASLLRRDGEMYIQLMADVSPGVGLGQAIESIEKVIREELPPPPSIRYEFTGQGESYDDMAFFMPALFLLSAIIIFLILASLYESFSLPFAVVSALPFSICGAVTFLFLFNESLNLYSSIGILLLLGIATKNAILLVDFAKRSLEEGMSPFAAMLKSSRIRLRPILMTSFSLVLGTIPLAIGLNEASVQRTSMGVAVLGGTVSSTLLTLFTVPAVFILLTRRRTTNRTTIIDNRHGGGMNPFEPISEAKPERGRKVVTY